MVKLTKRNKEVDKQLQKHFKDNEFAAVFLLLGVENSGKHTFLKQLETIHNQKYDSNLEEYTSIIEDNLISSISTLCSFVHYNNINTCNEIVKEIQSELSKEVNKEKLCELCEKVYRDESVYELVQQNLVDYTREVYFLDNMDRLKMKDYLPTREDIFYTSFPRKRSFFEYKERKNTFKFVIPPISKDFKLAHSMTSERNIDGQTNTIAGTCIVYFVDMLSLKYTIADDKSKVIFDEVQPFHEDIEKLHSLNLLKDSLVFYTKSDLFHEKLKKEGCTFEPGRDRIPLPHVQEYSIYYHFVRLVDTQNIRFVWRACEQISTGQQLRG